MVTVYSVAGASSVAGVKRSVMGSRHSSLPAIAGAIVKILLGSTAASSAPATGRSNGTVMTPLAAAVSAGVTRRTRSGVTEDTAKLPIASVTTAESARIEPWRWRSEEHTSELQSPYV